MAVPSDLEEVVPFRVLGICGHFFGRAALVKGFDFVRKFEHLHPVRVERKQDRFAAGGANDLNQIFALTGVAR